VEQGRQALPRPPRRIPAGAAPLTQLEPARSAGPDGRRRNGPDGPRRTPWLFGRFLAGFLVLLVVIAVGAGAGWFLRRQSLRIDTAAVLKSAGPAVVRVLATTCAGSGEATGVLIDNGRVLTTASAVDQPRSIVVVAPDGHIRRANLLGTSADGVAVLQSIGFDGEPLHLAPEQDPKAERALIGYTNAGRQVVNAVGSAADPVPTSSFMNAAKLGSPVLDKNSGIVGLVTGDDVHAADVVPLTALRGYAAPAPTGLTVAAAGTCARSKGSQNPIAPALQVANTPQAVEVQQLFANYFTLENRQDYTALQALYSKRYAATTTVARDQRSHETSYFFNPRITDLAPDASWVRIAYNVLFSPTATGAAGRNCDRLDIRFQLVRTDGKLLIDRVSSMRPKVSCDTD
jgi:hypothetical protein